MATEIDILNSDINEQKNYNSINNSQDDLIESNNTSPVPLSISKSREKRLTKLLLVGIILPFSVLLNIQSSEIPAWYNKETKDPIYFPFSIVVIRTLGQIAGTIATIALFLKSVHIGSSFRILKYRFYKKHRGVIMIIGVLIQCICSLIILIYYLKNYRSYNEKYVLAGEVSYFTIQSIILSFLSALLLSRDANKRNRIFRQSGQKPKNRLSYMQRQLIVLEILVIFYIIIGGVLYSKLEGWTFNDAVYFSIITLMTCGTGDFSPKTFAGRMILIIYAIPGIALTAYTVYSIYSVISEIIYAKVYKDFSRFINTSNDIFFQNLIKRDKAAQNSSSQNLNSNSNEVSDVQSSSTSSNEKQKNETKVKFINTNPNSFTYDEPLSILSDQENESEENNKNNNNESITNPTTNNSNININNSDNQTRRRILQNRNNTNNGNIYNVSVSNYHDKSKGSYYFEPRKSILINDNTIIPVQSLRFDPVKNNIYNDYESSSDDDSCYSDEDESISKNSELDYLINNNSKQNWDNNNCHDISNMNSNNNNNNNNYNRNRKCYSYCYSGNKHYSTNIYQNNRRGSTTSLFNNNQRHLCYSLYKNNYYPDNLNDMNFDLHDNNSTDENNTRPKALMLARRNTLNIGQTNVQEMQIFSSNQDIDTDRVLQQTRDLNIRQLKLSLGVLIFIIAFFSLIYSWVEDWSFFEAIYFCFINLCTIGYGDFVPSTIYGKSIYIYFIYLSVPATTWLGTVLFELATGRWEVYIEKTDLEDELIRNDFDKQSIKKESEKEEKKENEKI